MEKRIIPVVIVNQTLSAIFSEIIHFQNHFKHFQLKMYNQDELIKSNSGILITDNKLFISKQNILNHFEAIFLINTEQKNIKINYLESKVIVSNAPLILKDLFNRISNFISQQNLQTNRKLRYKKFVYDPIMRTLSNQNSSIRLTEKETQIFQCLLDNRNKHLSKKDLLKKVWSYDENIDTHTLETHIYSLRKKIQNNLLVDDLIIFEEKRGYLIDKNILED